MKLWILSKKFELTKSISDIILINHIQQLSKILDMCVYVVNMLILNICMFVSGAHVRARG